MDTSSPPGAPTTTSPQLVTETKFMENYRVASAVNGGSEVVAVANGSGQVELFTLGTDGTVWNFYPDTTSETGYSGVSLGVQAAALAAGVDASGHVVVFAASGLQLLCLVETGNPASRWGPAQAVRVPPPPQATRIARVVAQEIGGALYVGVLTQYPSASGTMYSVACSQWDSDAPVFQRTPMNVGTTQCVWLGSTAQTAAFAAVDTIVVAYGVATGQVTRYPMGATFRSISVDAATDGTGASQLFAILADGNAYHLIGGGSNQPYSWAQLSQGMTFRQVLADTDGTGAVHLFAVSGDNALYHWDPSSGSQTGFSNPPAKIHSGIALLGLAGNDAGNIDLFAVGTAQGTLTHLFLEEVSTNWVAQRLEVPSSTQVERYVSYTTDVTVYDAAGAPLVNSPVSLWASEETRVTVNGATYFVDARRPARTSTNGAGVLSISQETGSLAIPTLRVNVTQVMAPGESLAIQQSADVQSRLAGVSATDLLDAKDASGSFLLPDQYRNQQTADSLASAFNQCMSLGGGRSTATASLLRRNGPRAGVHYLPFPEALDDVRRVGRPEVEQHWQLRFADGQVVYRELTADAAAALLVEKRATLHSAFGFFDWLEDIGDFVEGVVDGVVSVVDTVITTVSNAVKAAFTFIVDGVTYLFETVINFVEQAFDAVEAFFAQVGVFFEKLFEWLGFLFAWDDILRTHEALAYTLNQFLDFLPGAATGIQTIVDDGITNVQSQITTLFDWAVSNVAGGSSVGGFEQSNQRSSPQFSSATSNNIVYNGFIDNANGASGSASAALLALDTDPITQLIQQLSDFVDNSEASQAFSDALDYFQNLGGSPDQIFTQLLAGMMRVVQGVIQSILAGVRAIVDALMAAVRTLMQALKAVLTEEWDIPFVSPLYSWITGGSTLTSLDLFALVVAIPTTVFYKAAYGAAPFPDDASVAAFRASFSAQTMLRAAGFGAQREATAGEALAADAGGALVSEATAKLLTVGSAVATFFYGAGSALLDAIPKTSAHFSDEAQKVISKGVWMCEAFAQVCSFPWFTSSGAPDCTTTDGKQKTLWIYTCLGITIDAAFIAAEGRIPENWDDKGVGVTFFYGVGHLTVAIVASVGQSGVPVAVNILPCIPELGKLLRLTRVVTATKGISLAVIAGIDVVFYTTTAILGVVQPSGSEAPAKLLPAT